MLWCLADCSGKVKIGMDMATLEFLTNDKMYDLDLKNQNNYGSQKKFSAEMLELSKDFCPNYPIVIIEDPFD